MRRTLAAIIPVFIFTCSLSADLEPSALEGTFKVTRINTKSGDKYSEELRISRLDGYCLLENIQGGDGGELLEQEGIEHAGWLATASTDFGGSVGLYRISDKGISGMELYVPDTTFYEITSGDAEPPQLVKQWSRGHYQHVEYCPDGKSNESGMELTGDSELWVMTWYPWWADSRDFSGCGISSGNTAAMLFEMDKGMILRLYTVTGGNLEGRWLHTWLDEENGCFVRETGAEELWVEKVYE